jgi:glycosyltransferase 2 family protein
MKSPAAQKAIVAVKAVVSIGLIGFLLASMDWTKLFDHLEGMNWPFVGVAFAIFVVQFPLSAYKWQRSLRVHELEYPFWFLLRVLSIGFFFNNFLPSSIGGDGYRVLRTLPASGTKSRALSAVILERALGFAALLFVGFLGALVILFRSPSPIVISFVTLIGSGMAALGLLFVLARFGHLGRLWEFAARNPKLRVLTESAGLIARSRRPLAELVFWSFVFQALGVIAVSALFAAVGQHVEFAICAVVGTMSALAAVLPISINGIGVSEGSFVAASVQLGVGLEQAVIVALLTRAMGVPLSVGCGFVYLWEIRSPAGSGAPALPLDPGNDPSRHADGQAPGGDAAVND